ncbi:MAG TPA: SDR family oxidoreductase [Solirubrobacterales bacterium]|nr:SDR family oxidoreductase [Solirubrobacterales bacterium]
MSRRAALVLGGSGGIGLAIARVLAEEGYSLTIQGRRADKVEAALDALWEVAKDAPLGLTADLSSEEEIVEAVAAHEERWGRMDVLINSAGLGMGQPVAEIRTKSLDLQLAVNLRAAVLTTRESLPQIERAGAEHGEALIVHVSSWAGKHPPAWLSVYGATKAALCSFAASTQVELAGKGVQVTALCPATVETEMTTYAQGEIPAEAMLRPSDLAEAVRFLLRTSPNCVIPEIVLGRVGDLG